MGWVDIVYPKQCFGCGKRGEYFCQQCRQEVKIREQVCPKCNRASVGGWRHKRCGQGVLERVIAPLRYRGMVSKGLRRVKFGSSWAVLEELFEWWWEVMRGDLESLDKEEWLVSWIPMFAKKKKRRGFNQAEILGKKLAERLEMRNVKTLIRQRETLPQYGLSREERQKNMRGAFIIEREAKKLIYKKKVMLVDDIWTTGSTMREAVKVLKRNGVETVWAVVVGR